MRLGPLLSALPAETVEQLCRRLVPGGEEVPAHLRPTSVESLLRDSGFIEQTLYTHRPPVLGILRELLEASGHRLPLDTLKAGAMAATNWWCGRVSEGSLAARSDSFRLYRRLLAGAWDSDLRLDSSERALLGILRREIGMTPVEHFLTMHHPDIQPYWKREDCFETELGVLADNGLLFRVEGDLILAEEMAGRIGRALGLRMREKSALRMLEHLSNEDIGQALETFGARKSGDKAERIRRVVDDFIPVHHVVDSASIGELQQIARKVGAAVSGSKGELVERLIDYFDQDQDLRAEEALAAASHVHVEPKELGETAFKQLFQRLTGHQLELLLRRHELKVSGSKETRLDTLWGSPLSERSLLRSLKNPDLSSLCDAHEIDSSGAKEAMIDRLLKRVSTATS